MVEIFCQILNGLTSTLHIAWQASSHTDIENDGQHLKEMGFDNQAAFLLPDAYSV